MSFVDELVWLPVAWAHAFTPDGRHVARLTDRDGPFAIEVRDLDDPAGRSERAFGPDPRLSLGTAFVMPASGCVRLGLAEDGRYTVVEARRGPAGWTPETVARCDADTLSFAVEDLVFSCADGVSTLWHVSASGLQELAQVPGVLSGGAWLLPGRVLAGDLSEPGGKASGYAIDLAAQTYHRLFHVSADSDDRIAECDPQRGLLVVTSDWSGNQLAGVAHLRGGRQVRFFPSPGDVDRPMDVCGRTGDGQVVLRRHYGMRGELWLADPGDLRVHTRLATPLGTVGQPVAAAGTLVRFPLSTPTVPPTCASHQAGRFALDETPDLGGLDPRDLVEPRVESFAGPRGDIEMLVYEPPAARRRDLVVVALHGGPVGQWAAVFTPELQLLASLGATVLAPNYHGSFGYGREFVQALEGKAGAVDVDDVVAVAVAAGAGERPTVLYGQSYGAFLGLLTAAAHPWLCDGVIAVAPFVSLTSLGAVGTPQVRRLVELLQGADRDGRETDLLRRCADLRAKLLIAHGEQDDVIPIAQSQALCERLRAHGYEDDRTLWFLPLPTEDHAISGRAARLRLYRQMELFVTEIAAPAGRTTTLVAPAGTRPMTWAGGLSSRNGASAPMRNPPERR